MSPPGGRPETPSPESHLLRVVVPRLHRDDVMQDGRPVEEGNFPRLHSPTRQVAHLRGLVVAAPLLPILDRHLHLLLYLPHRRAGRVVGGEGLMDASWSVGKGYYH